MTGILEAIYNEIEKCTAEKGVEYRFMRGKEKRESQRQKVFKGKKDRMKGICRAPWVIIVLTILTVILTGFGIFVDSVYWGYVPLPAIVVNYWKTRKVLGITYMGALKILGNNVGMLMTMVSIFLTMGINAAESSEKKVYGIYRKDLPSSDNRGKLLKWTCYASPVLMIICLNLSYCVCGYLLIFYCYLFLIIRYHKHEESYRRVPNRDAVVRKLIECLPQEGNWDREVLSKYQMILENIGRSAEKEGNWQEIKDLFYNLLSYFGMYHIENKVLIIFYFERAVYWTDNERGRKEAIALLSAEIERIAQETSNDRKMTKEHQAVLWGMLPVVIMEAKEEELINFFQWFLDIPAWSGRVLQRSGEIVSLDVIVEEMGVMLLFLEYRFRIQYLEELQLQRQVRAIWGYAKNSFLGKGNEDFRKISCCYSNLLEEGEVQLKKCLESLYDDFTDGTKESLISNILTFGGE